MKSWLEKNDIEKKKSKHKNPKFKTGYTVRISKQKYFCKRLYSILLRRNICD